MSSPTDLIPEDINEAASHWLSRRDRGLTATEQDAYLEWLYRSPLHGRAIVQFERGWATLNKLEQWRPAHSAIPNPDLLMPRRSRSRVYWLATALAAAAALGLAFYVWLPARAGSAAPRREAIVHPGPEKLPLEDGSLVELNTGAQVAVFFTPTERRVQLLRGEAHFTVAHNAARPFFVDTGKVSVRAVGTAFNVALGAQEVAVLVTEGKVQVLGPEPQSPEPVAAEVQSSNNPAQLPPTYLVAGQRAVVNLAAPAAPVVQEYTPVQMERALAWQGLRLEFVDMPLRDVAAEFNRYNRAQLSAADAETAAILVGGNFRADNVEAFVRLLESGFNVRAFRHGNEIILRAAP